jgi:hypothetical protein
MASQSRFATCTIRRQDHLAHAVDTITLKEHVLRAAQTDALRTKCHRNSRLIGLIGIRPNFQAPRFTRPAHQLFIKIFMVVYHACQSKNALPPVQLFR